MVGPGKYDVARVIARRLKKAGMVMADTSDKYPGLLYINCERD